MSRRKRPAPPQSRPSRNNTNAAEFTVPWTQHWNEPLTAEDRAVAQAIDTLRQHGYGIALRCLDCHRPITSQASLTRMRGPRCAARAVGA